MPVPSLRRRLGAPVPDPQTTDPQFDGDLHTVSTEDLIERAQRTPDPVEREELLSRAVVRHLPLAQTLASRYRDRGESLDDLVQVAGLGLVLAVQRYRPETGTPFVAFAVPTVLGELRRHFRDHCWTVRPPRRLQELRPRALAAQERLTQALGRVPTVNEVADELSADLADTVEALVLGTAYTPDSLEATEHGGPTPVAETLTAPDDAIDQVADRLSVQPVVGSLPRRTRRVLHLRYVEERSQRQIAAEIGVSQMQVSRILSQALQRVRSRVLTRD